MKGSFKLHEAQEKKKAEEPSIHPRPCVICGKIIPGAYGRWTTLDGDEWTCSKTHEFEYKEKRNGIFKDG